MKYFDYISKTKLDMLFNQVPESEFERVEYAFTLNLGFTKLELGKKPSKAETQEDRIAVLEKFLRTKGLLKNFDQQALLLEYTGRCVYFRSRIEEGLTLIAGGTHKVGFLTFCSTANFLGNSGMVPPEGELAFSFEPRALRSLAIITEKDWRDDKEMDLGTFGNLSKLYGNPFDSNQSNWEHIFSRMIHNNKKEYAESRNRIVFRRLRGEFDNNGRYLAVGTPIWIEAS